MGRVRVLAERLGQGTGALRPPRPEARRQKNSLKALLMRALSKLMTRSLWMSLYGTPANPQSATVPTEHR